MTNQPRLRPVGRNRDEQIEFVRGALKASVKRIEGYLVDWLADLAKQAPKTRNGRPRKSHQELKVAATIDRIERNHERQKRGRLIAKAREERQRRINAGEPRKTVTKDVSAKLAKALGNRSDETAYDLLTRTK